MRLAAKVEKLAQQLRSMAVAPPTTPDEERKREAARKGLLDFICYTYPDYRPNWHHRLLCERLERWADTPGDRLVVSMPPQHGKSQIISRHFPAWLLGREPDAPVMLCSYAASLANRFNRQVQRIVSSPAYAEVFPGTRPPRRGRDEGQRTSDLVEIANRSGSLRTAGVGGSITGMGFRYGLIDDPVKGRKKAESPTERESTWEWFTGDFYTRRSPGARMLVVATRWHEEDLPGRLLRQGKDDPEADQWDELRLPAIAGESVSPGDPRKPGEALWPDRYPLSDLAKVRAQSEYDWWSLYQGEPRQGAHTEWPTEHFGEHLWFSDWPHLAVKVVALDPSKGRDSRQGDYAALVGGGYDGNGGGTLWVEADLFRLPPEALVKRAVDFCERMRPDVFVVESNMWQELLCAPMLAEAAKRGYALPVVPVENFVNKMVRIRRMGPYLGNRQLRVRATVGGRLLVDQLRQFPLADHDDGPDALEMCQRALVQLWNGRKGKR
jgi:predicted phage terminase large subunit-like protein